MVLLFAVVGLPVVFHTQPLTLTVAPPFEDIVPEAEAELEVMFDAAPVDTEGATGVADSAQLIFDPPFTPRQVQDHGPETPPVPSPA